MKNHRPLRFSASIGRNAVRITDAEVDAALAPDTAVNPIVIDFGDRYSDSRGASWAGAITELRQAVALARDSAEPLAIFAIGPIPMLVALGNLLGDKIAGMVYERHRHLADVDPASAWHWEEEGPPLAWTPFQPPRYQRGATDVAVLLSISGPVDPSAVAAVLPQQHPQYEIRLDEPHTSVVKTKVQLASFVRMWREVLDHIRETYGETVRVHVFPAVPVSAAVECGRRMLQVDPILRIYNAMGGVYRYALSVGPSGARREPEAIVNDKADVLVLVALEEEFEQLHSLLPEPVAIPDTRHGGVDYVCEVGDRQVVLRLVGIMGTGDAQLAADRAIERWHPRVAVWIGIAAGIHKDVRLVDVIVPDQIDGYDANQKVMDDGEGRVEFKHRGEVFRADHALVQAVQNLRFAQKAAYDAWAQACASDLSAELDGKDRTALVEFVRDTPIIKVGHIASGNVVVASEAFTAHLHRRDSSLIGLEMETAGLTRAAQKRVETIPVLALRGVSDFGDGRKATLDGVGGGVFRRVAMRNATRLLLTLFDLRIL
jgi:nucleoside phosphorylase